MIPWATDGMSRYKGTDGRMRLGRKSTPALATARKFWKIKMAMENWSVLSSKKSCV